MRGSHVKGAVRRVAWSLTLVLGVWLTVGVAPAVAQSAPAGGEASGAPTGAYAATRAQGSVYEDLSPPTDGLLAAGTDPGSLSLVALAGGDDLGDRAMAELRARIRGMREPLRIVMVTWRGWTDTDQGFQDYFESHRIPVEPTILDAGRDRSRLPEFVKQIRDIKPDLVYTWGTTVSLGILGRYDTDSPEDYITDIPAVFANVSYPVVSGLVPSLDLSGRAITGSTFLVPLDAQLRAIRSYRPFSVLGVVYNPKESNSRNVVETLRALAVEQGDFTLVDRPVPLDDAGAPIVEALPGLVAQVAEAGADFLYIPPDSFLSGNKVRLTAAAVEARLPTFAAAEGTLEDSKAMMGLISRYYNIGKLTAHLATRILVGQEDPASIPIASLARYSLVLNMDVIRELEFYPPIGLLQISEIKDSRAESLEPSSVNDEGKARAQSGGGVR